MWFIISHYEPNANYNGRARLINHIVQYPDRVVTTMWKGTIERRAKVMLRSPYR